MRKILLTSLLSAFLTTSVLAETSELDTCTEKAANANEITVCLETASKKSDDALNAIYKKLRTQLEEKEQKEALKTTQKAWIKFRDLECDLRTQLIATSPVQTGLSCLIELTDERTQHLENMTI